MRFNKTILPNGLRFITVPMPSFESATVMVMVGAGSRYETKKNSGISHFLEHMAFKGTEKRPTALIISSLIDGMGGEFNAFTGKESTGYYIKAAKNNVELCLDVLADMLQNSKLEQVEIDKEKGVILEEINLYEDTPMRKIGDIYESLLYGDTPLGWDIAGEKDIIRQINRQDFLDYMGGLYSADNMTVVVAGGIDEGEVKNLVEKYFNGMKKFKTPTYEKIVESQKKPAVLIKEKKTEQIHIAMGVRTTNADSPEKYPLEVLSAILGGGMSSRLFHEIREKRGLAYYVRSSSDHYKDCGSFVTMAGIDPKRVLEAVSVLAEEYEKVKDGKLNLTEEEITKAKEFLKGHFVLELEDSRSVASYYASQELLEEEKLNPDEVLAKIDSIDPIEIAEVGQKYFKNGTLNLALIGDFSDRQKLEDIVKLT
ncbi:MAG TPA: pitrilysin family protein [Patescibacteria group bacterium]|nr:pitrilysin family protein [Patescibacteria group bacterium]